MEKDLQTVIFTWFAKNSRLIISIFHFAFYTGLVILVGFAYLEMQDKYLASIYAIGKWWTYLHRFIYVAIWILVLHVGLQKISIWTLGIFTVGALEVTSWVYYFLNKTAASTTSGGNRSPGQNQGQGGTNIVNPL